MQNCLEEKCTGAQNNVKKNFPIVKEIIGGWSPHTNVPNDIKGNVLMEAEEIKARWADYCKGIYKTDRPTQIQPY